TGSSPRNSVAAISALDIPRASSRRTSTSRSVSTASLLASVAAGRARANCSISRRVTVGAGRAPPPAQHGPPARVGGGRPRQGELLDQPPRDRRGEQGLALGRHPDRSDQVLRGAVLEQESAGALPGGVETEL